MELDEGEGPVPLAPAAGHIVDTGQVALTNGYLVPALLLETSADADNAAAASEFAVVTSDAIVGMLSGLGPAAFKDRTEALRGGGVWANRWTSPDLPAQLRACRSRIPDTILCSLLDIDRALGINSACAREHPAEIVAAVAALARLTSARRAWFAVDAGEDGTDWAGIQRAAAEVAGDLRFVPIENHYPQPDPTLLLYSLTGRRLRRAGCQPIRACCCWTPRRPSPSAGPWSSASRCSACRWSSTTALRLP